MLKKIFSYLTFAVLLSSCPLAAAQADPVHASGSAAPSVTAAKGLSVEEAGKIPVTGHTIVVGKNIKDWVGVAPEEENSTAVNNGEYIWKDATGDDTGNGKYTYPLDKALKKGADLKEFRLTFDKDNLYFLIKTDIPADWWTGYKIIGIHKEGAPGGMTVLAQGDIDEPNFDKGISANLKVAPALACQYVVAISSIYKGRIYDENGKMIARREEQPDDTPGFKIDDFNWNAVEVAIPLKLIGGSPAGQTWKFIVATGQQDNDVARKVDAERTQYHGGGGAENGENPNVYDLAGADKETQEKELGSYDPNAKEGDPKGFATIEKSFLTVNFGTK
jgi:hypothetical protein